MSKRQLLFVTYEDENLDEGLSYAIELAKAMSEDIVLLVVRKTDSLTRKFEDLMAGVAFAEAGECETAREIVAGKAKAAPTDYSGKIAELVVRASKAGVHLSTEHSDKDVIYGIRTYLRAHSGIDKVVLSPAVTESEVLTTKELSRLVRNASRPIVTMTRQSVRAMRDAARSEKGASCFEPSVSF
jgi:hypothetical protein